MSQSTELHVPDGYYPPFAVVSDTDHGAYIIIAVSLGITLVLISSFIRAFIRISFAQRAGLDDAFLAAATVGGPVISGRKDIFVDLASRFLRSYSHVSFWVHAHVAWAGRLIFSHRVQLTVFKGYTTCRSPANIWILLLTVAVILCQQHLRHAVSRTFEMLRLDLRPPPNAYRIA